MSATIAILGMAVITFSIKALVFILGDRVSFSPTTRRALSFVPVTVLTAIIVPMVLAPRGQGLEWSWRNTTVTMSWAYASAMPRLFGIGLSPVAQWMVVPAVVFLWIRRSMVS